MRRLSPTVVQFTEDEAILMDAFDRALALGDDIAQATEAMRFMATEMGITMSDDFVQWVTDEGLTIVEDES